MASIYNPEKHHRRSIRLKDYDYSQPGEYFVTICTRNKECIFGEIIEDRMQLNEYGKIANDFWNEISIHFPGVKSDKFVVMPNHIHGIIMIMNSIDDNRGRGEVTSPLQPIQPMQPITLLPSLKIKKITLGKIIAYYKYQTTKLINEKHNTAGISVWQRNYYEHIIRTDKDVIQIKEYIENNPLKWEFDKENPN